MIKLPKKGKKLQVLHIIQWDTHSQQDFNKLDKPTLDRIVQHCKHYMAIMNKLKQKIDPKVLEALAFLNIKCTESYKFNNYN